MQFEKLDTWLELHKAEMLEDILQLIRIPSVSSDPEKIKAALQLVINKGKAMGFASHLFVNKQVGRIDFGEGKETIGILTHVDVVPAGGTWLYPPYQGVIARNWIYGRGAMDDKGPLIASLYAMKALKELGEPLYKKIQLIIGTQEEILWHDIEEYAQRFQLPDYGFTPDASFPIANREKGYFDIKFSFPKAALLGGEFEVITLKGGETPNSIPATAGAIISGDYAKMEKILNSYLDKHPLEGLTLAKNKEKIQLVASGKSTHSCYPEKGTNAIGVLCKFLKTLKIKQAEILNFSNFVAKFLAEDYYGKLLGLYKKSEYYQGEYVHRNVISPTLLTFDKEGLKVCVNLRTAHGTSRRDLDSVFTALKQQYNYEFEYLEEAEAIFYDRAKPCLRAMETSYEEVAKLKSDFILEYGETYAKAMPNIVPFGPIFPGEKDYCHEIDERWNVDSCLKNAKIYAHTLARLALTKESFK
jgi:succinyl-diaminopimelate desuccinylase